MVVCRYPGYEAGEHGEGYAHGYTKYEDDSTDKSQRRDRSDERRARAQQSPAHSEFSHRSSQRHRSASSSPERGRRSRSTSRPARGSRHSSPDYSVSARKTDSLGAAYKPSTSLISEIQRTRPRKLKRDGESDLTDLDKALQKGDLFGSPPLKRQALDLDASPPHSRSSSQKRTDFRHSLSRPMELDDPGAMEMESKFSTPSPSTKSSKSESDKTPDSAERHSTQSRSSASGGDISALEKEKQRLLDELNEMGSSGSVSEGEIADDDAPRTAAAPQAKKARMEDAFETQWSHADTGSNKWRQDAKSLEREADSASAPPTSAPTSAADDSAPRDDAQIDTKKSYRKQMEALRKEKEESGSSNANSARKPSESGDDDAPSTEFRRKNSTSEKSKASRSYRTQPCTEELPFGEAKAKDASEKSDVSKSKSSKSKSSKKDKDRSSERKNRSSERKKKHEPATIPLTCDQPDPAQKDPRKPRSPDAAPTASLPLPRFAEKHLRRTSTGKGTPRSSHTSPGAHARRNSSTEKPAARRTPSADAEKERSRDSTVTSVTPTVKGDVFEESTTTALTSKIEAKLKQAAEKPDPMRTDENKLKELEIKEALITEIKTETTDAPTAPPQPATTPDAPVHTDKLAAGDSNDVTKKEEAVTQERKDSTSTAEVTPSKQTSVEASDSEGDLDTTIGGMSLDERLRAIDEKLSIVATNEAKKRLSAGDPAATATPTLDYRDKYRVRKRVEPTAAPTPEATATAAAVAGASGGHSDIVKSLLARSSIFDQDTKRLDRIEEKYAPSSALRAGALADDATMARGGYFTEPMTPSFDAPTTSSSFGLGSSLTFAPPGSVANKEEKLSAQTQQTPPASRYAMLKKAPNLDMSMTPDASVSRDPRFNPLSPTLSRDPRHNQMSPRDPRRDPVSPTVAMPPSILKKSPVASGSTVSPLSRKLDVTSPPTSILRRNDSAEKSPVASILKRSDSRRSSDAGASASGAGVNSNSAGSCGVTAARANSDALASTPSKNELSFGDGNQHHSNPSPPAAARPSDAAQGNGSTVNPLKRKHNDVAKTDAPPLELHPTMATTDGCMDDMTLSQGGYDASTAHASPTLPTTKAKVEEDRNGKKDSQTPKKSSGRCADEATTPDSHKSKSPPSEPESKRVRYSDSRRASDAREKSAHRQSKSESSGSGSGSGANGSSRTHAHTHSSLMSRSSGVKPSHVSNHNGSRDSHNDASHARPTSSSRSSFSSHASDRKSHVTSSLHTDRKQSDKYKTVEKSKLLNGDVGRGGSSSHADPTPKPVDGKVSTSSKHSSSRHSSGKSDASKHSSWNKSDKTDRPPTKTEHRSDRHSTAPRHESTHAHAHAHDKSKSSSKKPTPSLFTSSTSSSSHKSSSDKHKDAKREKSVATSSSQSSQPSKPQSHASSSTPSSRPERDSAHVTSSSSRPSHSVADRNKERSKDKHKISSSEVTSQTLKSAHNGSTRERSDSHSAFKTKEREKERRREEGRSEKERERDKWSKQHTKTSVPKEHKPHKPKEEHKKAKKPEHSKRKNSVSSGSQRRASPSGKKDASDGGEGGGVDSNELEMLRAALGDEAWLLEQQFNTSMRGSRNRRSTRVQKRETVDVKPPSSASAKVRQSLSEICIFKTDLLLLFCAFTDFFVSVDCSCIELFRSWLSASLSFADEEPQALHLQQRRQLRLERLLRR